MVTATPLTTDQFLEWSTGLEHSYELIKGIPVRMTPERFINTYVAKLLSTLLDNFFKPYQTTNSIEIELDSGNTRIPDLCVLTEATARSIAKLSRAIVRAGKEPPLIVVEIVSPSSGGRDYDDKVREYAATGIQEYWILEPDTQAASIYRLNPLSEYELVSLSELVPVDTTGLQTLIKKANEALLDD